MLYFLFSTALACCSCCFQTFWILLPHFGSMASNKLGSISWKPYRCCLPYKERLNLWYDGWRVEGGWEKKVIGLFCNRKELSGSLSWETKDTDKKMKDDERHQKEESCLRIIHCPWGEKECSETYGIQNSSETSMNKWSSVKLISLLQKMSTCGCPAFLTSLSLTVFENPEPVVPQRTVGCVHLCQTCFKCVSFFKIPRSPSLLGIIRAKTEQNVLQMLAVWRKLFSSIKDSFA